MAAKKHITSRLFRQIAAMRQFAAQLKRYVTREQAID